MYKNKSCWWRIYCTLQQWNNDDIHTSIPIQLEAKIIFKKFAVYSWVNNSFLCPSGQSRAGPSPTPPLWRDTRGGEGGPVPGWLVSRRYGSAPAPHPSPGCPCQVRPCKSCGACAVSSRGGGDQWEQLGECVVLMFCTICFGSADFISQRAMANFSAHLFYQFLIF